VGGDVFFQAHQGLGVAIHGTGGADEPAVAIADAEHGDFFTVQAQAHDGAQERHSCQGRRRR
jgi:hypothetical protein